MLAKILQLPPRRQEELDAVIDDMLSREQQLSPDRRKGLEGDAAHLIEDQEYERLVRAAQTLSSPVLAKAWDNPKDAKYNDL